MTCVTLHPIRPSEEGADTTAEAIWLHPQTHPECRCWRLWSYCVIDCNLSPSYVYLWVLVLTCANPSGSITIYPSIQTCTLVHMQGGCVLPLRGLYTLLGCWCDGTRGELTGQIFRGIHCFIAQASWQLSTHFCFPGTDLSVAGGQRATWLESPPTATEGRQVHQRGVLWRNDK